LAQECHGLESTAETIGLRYLVSVAQRVCIFMGLGCVESRTLDPIHTFVSDTASILAQHIVVVKQFLLAFCFRESNEMTIDCSLLQHRAQNIEYKIHKNEK
jgi:hypothetical protein